MLNRSADRFAETALSLFSKEGTFAIGVESEEEIEPIAEAFERLGCWVAREPLRYRVKVTSPAAMLASSIFSA